MLSRMLLLLRNQVAKILKPLVRAKWEILTHKIFVAGTNVVSVNYYRERK
jgi:hypothetical protein